ncbi:outer membrane beta-barrel protein [Solimonas marina]|uniref:Outer membrane protein beta-barrel domain-containing protein n=1 Tax=Solimonas marina TaxID=2714601 RepID=A0A969W7L6_9GAMM|nr:hypothetical protein [Solimonas marina]NKF21448.1 hypothetical protein [Solimonas marina]
MKNVLMVVGTLVALGLTSNALAQETETYDPSLALNGRPWYGSAMFSYTDSDSDRGTKGGLGGTVSVGKKVTWGLALELTGFYSSMDGKADNGTTDLYGYGASALFFPSRKWAPNAYGIVSLMQGKTNGLPGPRHNYDSTVFDAGIGYLQPLTPRIKLRIEARYRTDDKGSEPTGSKGKNSNFAEGVYSVGVLIPFGHVVTPEPPASETPAAVVDTSSADDDNDGVPNDKDQCPASPPGAVDDNGCPIDSGSAAAAPADDATAPASDSSAPASDCATPTAGQQVDENGCAVEPGK